MNKALIVILVLACASYTMATGCKCVVASEQYLPWAALCPLNNNCNNKDSCVLYAPYCEWNGFTDCKCTLKDGVDSGYQAFCSEGCTDYTYCTTAGASYCNWNGTVPSAPSNSCHCKPRIADFKPWIAFCNAACNDKPACKNKLGAAYPYCKWYS